MSTWERNVRQFVRSEFQSDFVKALVLSETILTDEVVRAGLTLLPFLLIGFSIMVVFSSCTMSISAFYVRQMGAQKILLAVVACSCPFMACGSLLCVTPFLVLAIGVDDAYLMLNAWQRLRVRLEERLEQEGRPVSVQKIVQRLMADVMVDTGASITITVI
uniref:SSD domain-containing protein n=1 Tax=Globodera pallida TaxID=36090 RepID=A0A183CHX2_GLOPA